MPIKIAMIGAGSIGFTRKLMHDILAVPELAGTHFAFMDINAGNLDMVMQLAQRDIDANGLPAAITPTTNRREAITDADYVISVVRQGGLDAFQLDIDIPLKYGIDQCVGDTICAGGIMYGQRTIPALLDVCADIRAVAKPDALFLNYSNPMAMNVWACNQYGGVRTVGLCHGVQGGHWQITRCIEEWARREGMIAADETLHRDEVDIICAGINHQTWYNPGAVAGARHGAAHAGAVRGPPGISHHRKAAHRHDPPLRLLHNRIQRPRQRIRALVPKTPPTKSTTGSTSPAGSTARPAAICASAPKAATGSRPTSPTG